MREKRSIRPQDPVGDGLEQLQELGYLRSAAERLVARLLPRRAESLRMAFFASAWLGAGGGAFVALVLWGTALLAAPELLGRSSDSLWLLFDLTLLGMNLGLLLIFLVVWPLLRWLKRHGDANTERAQYVSALIPGALLALYLADAIGRHFLPLLGAARWPAFVVAAALAGAVGAMLTILLATLLAVARMRLKGHWRLGRLGARHRWIPWCLNSAGALLLLLVGPYPSLRSIPRLDEVAPPQLRDMRAPQLYVALESLPVRELRAGGGPPALAGLAAAAQFNCRVPGEQAALSFWSEISTGFSAEQHGLRWPSRVAPRGIKGEIHRFQRNPALSTITRHLLPAAGLTTLHASDQRELQRPPFWEIAAHAGRRILVVNWWASYPAVRHPRLRIASDRWMLRLGQGRAFAAEDSTLRAPENLAFELGLRGDLLQQVFRFRAQRRSVMAGDSLLAQIGLPDLQGWSSVADTWSYATTADALHTLLALRGLEKREFDAVVLQLKGFDVLQRRLTAATDAAGDDEELARRAQALRRIYLRFLDELWQSLVEVHEAEWTVLITESTPVDRDRALWSWQAVPHASPPPTLPSGWASLLLWQLGVPPAQDMAFPAEWADEIGPLCPTYGRRPDWSPASGRYRLDLDRLRSLGYIGD